MKTLIAAICLFVVLSVCATPINVKVTIPALGLTSVPATIDGLGTKVSAYPNVGTMLTNYFFLLSYPAGPTNYNISWQELENNLPGSTSNAFITLITSNFSAVFITNNTAFITNLYTQISYVSNAYITNITSSVTITTNLTVFNNAYISNIYVTNFFVSSNLYAADIVARSLTLTNVAGFASIQLGFDGNSNVVYELTGTNGGIFEFFVGGNPNIGINSNTFWGNGQAITNLTHTYTTSPIPAAASLSFNAAYFTNLTRNITLPAFTITNSAYYESLILWVTNGDGSDHTITAPGGVVGPPGSGTPSVLYCTNKMQTKIVVDHYGTLLTNWWKQDMAP